MKRNLYQNYEFSGMPAGSKSDEFEDLFVRYYPDLARMLMRYSDDPEQVKDWIQEIYVKMWNKRDAIDLDNIENKKGYFIVLARNHVIKRLSKKKQVRLVFGSKIGEFDIADNNLQEGIDHNELWRAYLVAVTKLPPKTREAFYLNREKGLTYRKVAERLGISVKTVEVQISRALAILRQELVSYSGNY